MNQSFKAIWYKSWTILLSKLQIVSSALTAGLYVSNNAFQSGEFHNLLGTIPNIPGWVPIALAALAFLTFVAHGREHA